MFVGRRERKVRICPHASEANYRERRFPQTHCLLALAEVTRSRAATAPAAGGQPRRRAAGAKMERKPERKPGGAGREPRCPPHRRAGPALPLTRRPAPGGPAARARPQAPPPPGSARARPGEPRGGGAGGGEAAPRVRARARRRRWLTRAPARAPPPPPPPPLRVPGARRAALLTSAGGRRCGVRRAAGALARCARPLPRPGCGARSLALPSFFSSLPPSFPLSLPLSPSSCWLPAAPSRSPSLR